MREAIAFLQRADLEIDRVLRQVLDRRLYRELGFESFDRHVVERLNLSARTAQRPVRIARAERGTEKQTAQAEQTEKTEQEKVATAFREGRITLLQTEALLRGAGTVKDPPPAEREQTRSFPVATQNRRRACDRI